VVVVWYGVVWRAAHADAHAASGGVGQSLHTAMFIWRSMHASFTVRAGGCHVVYAEQLADAVCAM
jgi:hypothetical protein